MPRPAPEPSRSSHATRCSPPGDASADSAASRSGTRSVSTDSSAPVTARRRIRAQRITPVSPMPPTVAANRSRSLPGSSSSTSPPEVSSPSASTWAPKVPVLPWFLPWMSAAIAPPTVTCWVPGTTAGIHPAGTATSSNSPIVRPASAVTVPAAGSRSKRLSAVASSTRPPRQLGRVAVAAAHPPRDRVGPDRSARAGHEFVQLIGRAGTYQGHRSTLTAAPAAHAGVRPSRAGA